MYRINCEYCECEISKSYYKRHLKTKKHSRNVKFKESEYIMCCICLENIKDKRNSKQTKCCHQFHKECLNKWLNISNTCPLCRYELKPVIREVEEIFINAELIPLLELNLLEEPIIEEWRFLTLD